MLKLISRPPIPLITVIVAACLAAHGVACSGVHYQDTPCSRHRSVYLLLATRATACSLDFCPNNWKSPPSPSPPPVIIHHSITNAAAAAVLCFSATKLDRITRRQGLICVGTVGNAVPILIFRWERRSHTYSYIPVGTQFLQRSVTISIRPILVAQQTTILPLMNVFIYLRSVLLIKLGHGHGLLKQAVAGPGHCARSS